LETPTLKKILTKNYNPLEKELYVFYIIGVLALWHFRVMVAHHKAKLP